MANMIKGMWLVKVVIQAIVKPWVAVESEIQNYSKNICSDLSAVFPDYPCLVIYSTLYFS